MRSLTRNRAPQTIVLLAFFSLVGLLLMGAVCSIHVPYCHRSVELLKNGSFVISEHTSAGVRWYDAEGNEIPASSSLLQQEHCWTTWCTPLDPRLVCQYGRLGKWYSGLVPLEGSTSSSLWRFFPHRGLFEEYCAESQRLLGSLGPDGYRKEPNADGPKFESAAQRHSNVGACYYVASGAKLYAVDLVARTAKPIFDIPNAANSSLAVMTERIRSPKSEGRPQVLRYFVVLSGGVLRVQSPEGREVFRARVPATRDRALVALGEQGNLLYDGITTAKDSSEHHYIALFSPTGRLVRWHTVRLAPRSVCVAMRRLGTDREMRFVPPAVVAALLYYDLFFSPDRLWLHYRTPFHVWCWIMGLGLFCGALLWALAWRDRTRAVGRVGWAVFGLGFSWIGVLTYLSLGSRSQREQCRSCGTPRPVNIVTCPACASPFPEPELTGIEVFDYARCSGGPPTTASSPL